MNRDEYEAILKRGIRLGLEAAADTLQAHDTRPGAWTLIVQGIRNLNPDTIAREAVLDQLTSEAQADNMGYDND